MQFRKKPVVIEAFAVNKALHAAAHDWDALPRWLIDAYDSKEPGKGIVFAADAIHIMTLEGTMIAERGDMIIRGVKGELYPCKPDIFEATYEPVTQPGAASPKE